jgi:hypothetical protein
VTEFKVLGVRRNAYCGTATIGERCQRLCRGRCLASGQKYSRIIVLMQALPTTTEKEELPKLTIAGFGTHIYVGTICCLQQALSAVQCSKHLKVYIGQVF